MSKIQIDSSLKDIIPNFSGAFPSQLVACVDSIYQLSLQKVPKLPNGAEVARLHLCTYLGAQVYQDKLNLGELLRNRIPAKPQLVLRLLDDLDERVVQNMSNSPRKRSVTPTGSPLKRANLPKMSSPLKKQQKLLENADDSSPNPLSTPEGKKALNFSTGESPFLGETPKKSMLMTTLTSLAEKSGPSSPKTPKHQKLSAPSSPSTPRYLRHLSMADFISFANNFYIPANVTPDVVDCFMSQKHKFVKKNEWLLACGLIYAAYTRINHRLIESTIGKKTELQDQLFQYQKGGLMKMNMVMWLNIIEESVKGEPWVIDLELKYVHNNWTAEDTTKEKEIVAKLGRGNELLAQFGSMITPSTMFNKESQKVYYRTWTQRLLEEVERS